MNANLVMQENVSRPIRLFDTHVHFWDPARSDWYPFLSAGAASAAGLGAAVGMKRRYDPVTYRTEAASVDIVGLVHVTATRGSGNYLEETLHIARLAESEGLPTALVGGFDPAASLHVIEGELDAQARVPLFAGVRTIRPVDFAAAKTAGVLRLVGDRGLVFDAVTHPAEMLTLANCLETSAATVVIEHTGWPLVPDDAAHTRQWRDGMRALAASGPSVYCKLSGLPMTLRTVDVDALRPWIEYAIEVFGVDRCLFGSNFPVDAMFGDFSDLFGAYRAITEPLGPIAQTKLFSDNARAVYARGSTTSDR